MSSGKNFFMIERRARLQRILEMVKKHKQIEARKIRALFVLQTGAKGNTVDAYIRELIEAGLIEWKDETHTHLVPVGWGEEPETDKAHNESAD